MAASARGSGSSIEPVSFSLLLTTLGGELASIPNFDQGQILVKSEHKKTLGIAILEKSNSESKFTWLSISEILTD